MKNNVLVTMAAKQTIQELQKKKAEEKCSAAIAAVWRDRKSITWPEAELVTAADVNATFKNLVWADKFQAPGTGTEVSEYLTKSISIPVPF